MLTIRFLVARNGVLCRDLWPGDIGVIEVEDIQLENDTAVDQWTRVPASFDMVCDWAFIMNDPDSPDRTRSYFLLYKQPEDSDPYIVYPVTLRIQGKIKVCNLGVLGNWNG